MAEKRPIRRRSQSVAAPKFPAHLDNPTLPKNVNNVYRPKTLDASAKFVVPHLEQLRTAIKDVLDRFEKSASKALPPAQPQPGPATRSKGPRSSVPEPTRQHPLDPFAFYERFIVGSPFQNYWIRFEYNNEQMDQLIDEIMYELSAHFEPDPAKMTLKRTFGLLYLAEYLYSTQPEPWPPRSHRIRVPFEQPQIKRLQELIDEYENQDEFIHTVLMRVKQVCSSLVCTSRQYGPAQPWVLRDDSTKTMSKDKGVTSSQKKRSSVEEAKDAAVKKLTKPDGRLDQLMLGAIEDELKHRFSDCQKDFLRIEKQLTQLVKTLPDKAKDSESKEEPAPT